MSKRSHQLDVIYLEALRGWQEVGRDEVYSDELLEKVNELASESPVEPPLLRRLGNSALRLFGKELPENSKPGFYATLYPTLDRLHRQGKVESRPEPYP